MKTARVLLLGMATVLLLGLLPLAAARADTLVVGPDGYATIEEAVGAAQPGDTISVAAGTYTLASQVVLNKANVTLVGAGSSSTIVQVAGSVGQYPFNITANGVTLKGLQIVQTDKPTQDLIYVGGNNLTVEDNLISGQYVLGDNNVSRAFVIAANASDVLIQNNTIRSLRQPAYISSRLGGTIKGNHVSGTRGWVVEGGDGFTFEGNTWGAGAEANIVDIAILSMAGPSLYPDILALSAANNGAVVEDQRVSPAVLTEVYVDAGAAEGGYGTSISPYSSIAPAIPRVVAGGKVHVAAGTYRESLGGWRDIEIFKSVNLIGAGSGQTVVELSGLQHGVAIRPDDGADFLIQGITFTKREGNAKSAGWGIIVGETGGTFNSLVFRDVEVAYAEARNVFLGNATYNSVTVEDCNIHHSGNWGFSARGTIGSLVVTNSHFDDNGWSDKKYGIGFDLDMPISVAQLTVTGGTFDRNTSKGINLVNTNNATFSGFTANHNSGAPGGGFGVCLWEWVGASSGLVFENADASHNSLDGLLFGTEGSTTISDVTVRNVYANGNGRDGILFYHDYGGSATNIRIEGCDLSGNADKGLGTSALSTVIDASGNWWGSADPAKVAGMVSGEVDYTPWLGSADDLANLWVAAASPQTGSVGRIQEAINLVPAGGTVNVAAGTYTENVTIDKMVTLLGAQAGVDARTRSGVAESLVQGRATVSAAASGTVIDGFTFQGPVSGTGMSAAGATIVNNIFDGFRYGLSLVPSSSGTVVQFNLFQTESWQGGQWMATNGIYSQSAGLSDVLVDSNKFTGHKGAAAIFSAQSAGGSMASITVSNNELVDDAPIKLMYVQDAEITNNTISGTAESDLKYGAIAIRGGVHNAQVTGNTIRTSQPSAIQIMDRNNETGPNSNLTISGNKMEGNDKGLDLVAGGFEGTLVAQNNWWGAASGPSGVGPGTGDSVSAGVTYSPWWANPAGTATASVGDDGSILVPENTPATDVQAILDSAPDDSTIVLAGDSYEGGLVINHPLTIIGADGTVIGPGSPAFTIASDGVTLDSLIIDGTRADYGTSGVVVNAGVSQLWIRRCEVRNWPADGIHFAGAITDLKLVDNHVHDNGLAGVSFAEAPAGIVQVYGNSFRNNGAEGIALAGPPPSLVARYNEWGDVEGPGGPNGDAAGAGVDYTPWVFGKLWVEADDNVRELDTTTVHVKVDTHQLFGASFALTFPTEKLQLVSAPAIGAFKAGTGAHFSASPVAEANATGVITVTAARGYGADGYDATDAVFLTLEFEAQEIEGTSVEAEIGFANDTADLAAKDGINIRLDSVTEDTIAIWGTTTVKGVVHLQGRDNHAGAAVTFPAGLLWPALTRHTDSWGRYTFDHVSDGDYDVTFVMARYLDTLVKVTASGDQLTLGTVLLLGGDTDDNDKIDLADIGCIGHNYGRTTDVDERADINGDGRVNILDLVLAAGNYGLTGYSWAG